MERATMPHEQEILNAVLRLIKERGPASPSAVMDYLVEQKFSEAEARRVMRVLLEKGHLDLGDKLQLVRGSAAA